jgi:hypothetical protein
MNRPVMPLKYVFDDKMNIVALGEFMPGDVIPMEFLGLAISIDGGGIKDHYLNPFAVDGGKIADVYSTEALKIEGGMI